MRKHEVQCQIEGDKEQFIQGIQNEVNSAYVRVVAEMMKKNNLLKEAKIKIINQIQGVY